MEATNTITITYGDQASSLAGMIPIDIISNILSYIDFDEYKKIHKNKMNKVLYELKNKNQDYISDLVCEHIVPFMVKYVFADFVNDGKWEIPFHYMFDIDCHFTDHCDYCRDLNCDCSTMFSSYVDEVLKENPNSNIVTDLQKIESNYMYDYHDYHEYHEYNKWEYFMNDIEGYVIHDCLSQNEEDEEEEEEIIQSGLEFIQLMYYSDDEDN